MKRLIILMLLGLLILSGCQGFDPQRTPSTTPDIETTATDSIPTSTAIPQQTLTICTAGLPESLFLYDGVQTPVKNNILALLSDPPFEIENGEVAPVILEKVPSQADGDVRLEAVTVEAGRTVVDAAGEVVVLTPGIAIRPSGCQSGDCVITWEGESPLEMDQMVIEYQLVDGLAWSDGVPVGADDSVFSFKIASDADAPGLQWAESRTESYIALDETRIQWTGLPGFTTAALERLFWTPLPAYQFSTATDWSDLVTDEGARTSPLSYGPFMLEEVGQDAIRFVPNPYYFRASEGTPFLDMVIIQAVAGGAEAAISMLESGGCDVLDSSFNLVESPALLDQVRSDDRFSVSVENGPSWVQLVFGIESSTNVAVGNNAEPTLLGDVRTRQAIFACLDREGMLANTIGDFGDGWPSFLPPEDSQLAPGEGIAYDPARSAELLASAGWVDHDDNPSTPLQAQGVINVPFGTPLSLDLFSSTSAFHQDLAGTIRDDLAVCGIEVVHKALPNETLYAPGPEGPLFGRQFDLGLINWQPMPQEDCHLYDSTQIPSAENYWIGTNIAGQSDQVYDEACHTASLALPEAREEALHQAERAYLDALPAVPLFSIPRVIVLPENACENSQIVTESEFFRRLEEYQLGTDCR